MKRTVLGALAVTCAAALAGGILVFPVQFQAAGKAVEGVADAAAVRIVGLALDSAPQSESDGQGSDGQGSDVRGSDGELNPTENAEQGSLAGKLPDGQDRLEAGASQDLLGRASGSGNLSGNGDVFGAGDTSGDAFGPTDASGRSGTREASPPSSNAQPGDEPELPAVPQCTIKDDRAPYGDVDSWQFTLLDHQYALASTYAPQDLVDVKDIGVAGKGQVREVMAADLKAMAKAARKAGAPIEVHSAYRSYEKQVLTYSNWESVSGSSHAKVSSARAGHSEHQLGTAIDVRSQGTASPWEAGYWGDTKAGTWMADNAWKYGFIMSYPDGESDQTCYMHEAWHFRYVGLDMALVVEESGLTLREFLWDNAQATGALS